MIQSSSVKNVEPSVAKSAETPMNIPCFFGLNFLQIAVIWLSFACGTQADDRLIVYKNATQGYKMAGKTVAPMKSYEELLRITADNSSAVKSIAQKVIARDMLTMDLKSQEQAFGNRLSEADLALKGLFAKNVVSNAITQAKGEKPDSFEDALGIAKELAPIVNRGLEAITNSYEVSRRGALIESLIRIAIRDDLQQTLGKMESVKLSDRVRLFESFYESKTEPYASVKLTNRTGMDLSSLCIFLELDCEYTVSADARMHNAIGQTLTNLLTDGAGPNYVPRQQALEKLANTDKGNFFYVENWPAGQIIELAALPVWEYVHTVKSARLEIRCKEFQSIEHIDIEKHKKLLRTKFTPKENRKR